MLSIVVDATPPFLWPSCGRFIFPFECIDSLWQSWTKSWSKATYTAPAQRSGTMGQHPEPSHSLAEQCPHLSLKSRYYEHLRQRALTVRWARRKRTCESTMCSRCTIFLIANVKTEISSEPSLQCDRPFLSLYHWPQLRFTVYYRLYANNDALESKNPIYSNDRFVGRISFKSITPPRNIASLKRNLWKVEGFQGIQTCALHLSLSEKAPAEDLTRLPLRGSGSSELDPMALVLNGTEVEKRLAMSNNLDSNTLPEWPHEQRYGERLFPHKVYLLTSRQSTIVLMMTRVRSYRRRLLMKPTHLWVALTRSPFPRRTTALLWRLDLVRPSSSQRMILNCSKTIAEKPFWIAMRSSIFFLIIIQGSSQMNR